MDMTKSVVVLNPIYSESDIANAVKNVGDGEIYCIEDLSLGVTKEEFNAKCVEMAKAIAEYTGGKAKGKKVYISDICRDRFLMFVKEINDKIEKTFRPSLNEIYRGTEYCNLANTFVNSIKAEVNNRFMFVEGAKLINLHELITRGVCMISVEGVFAVESKWC